jgi:hypothetical protein
VIITLTTAESPEGVEPVEKEERDAEAEPDADEGQLLDGARQQVVDDLEACRRRKVYT